MSAADRKVNVAILAVPDVTASALYGMLDLFASAGRDWSFVLDGVPGEPRMRPYTVSTHRNGLLAANNVWIKPDHGLEDCPTPDIVCIPDFFTTPGERCGGRFDAEVAWLRRCYAGSATMASSCTAALMLAEAGLLDDLDATIHWAYFRTLTNNFPRIRVHPDRSLVVSGTGQRIVTAGGGTSWQDLAIYLIGRFVGAKQAMEVAKTYLTNWHDAGQQPFASLLLARHSSDAVITKCQEWLGSHYTDRSPVSGMMKLSGLPERSFVRRFTKATGLSPLDYVHALRLEEAKQLLETEGLLVEAIANEVGYEDTSFFGRLFRRKVGLTPAQYRRRFGQLRSTHTASG